MNEGQFRFCDPVHNVHLDFYCTIRMLSIILVIWLFAVAMAPALLDRVLLDLYLYMWCQTDILFLEMLICFDKKGLHVTEGVSWQ